MLAGLVPSGATVPVDASPPSPKWTTADYCHAFPALSFGWGGWQPASPDLDACDSGQENSWNLEKPRETGRPCF